MKKELLARPQRFLFVVTILALFAAGQPLLAILLIAVFVFT